MVACWTDLPDEGVAKLRMIVLYLRSYYISSPHSAPTAPSTPCVLALSHSQRDKRIADRAGLGRFNGGPAERCLSLFHYTMDSEQVPNTDLITLTRSVHYTTPLLLLIPLEQTCVVRAISSRQRRNWRLDAPTHSHTSHLKVPRP